MDDDTRFRDFFSYDRISDNHISNGHFPIVKVPMNLKKKHFLKTGVQGVVAPWLTSWYPKGITCGGPGAGQACLAIGKTGQLSSVYAHFLVGNLSIRYMSIGNVFVRKKWHGANHKTELQQQQHWWNFNSISNHWYFFATLEKIW